MPLSIPKKLATFAIEAAKPAFMQSKQVNISLETQSLLENLTPFQAKILRVLFKSIKHKDIPDIISYIDNDFPIEIPNKDIVAIKSDFAEINNHEKVANELQEFYTPESLVIPIKTLKDLQPGDTLQVFSDEDAMEELLVFKREEGTGGEYFTVTPRKGGAEFNQTVKVHDPGFFTKVHLVKRPSLRSIMSYARKSEWGSAVLQPMFDIQYPLRALALSQNIKEELDCEDLDLLLDGALGNHGLLNREKSRKWLLMTLLFIARNEGISAENKEKRIEESFRLLEKIEPSLLQDLPQVRKFIQKKTEETRA